VPRPVLGFGACTRSDPDAARDVSPTQPDSAREVTTMTDVVKKSIWLLAAGFAAFYLLSQPKEAADAIQTAWQAVVDAFHQIMTFFKALAS
jgi:hypothetical protein